jgi:hypothetical protein
MTRYPNEQQQSPTVRLQMDGLITLDGDSHHTTKRWQGAMARAAMRLYEARDPGQDLRVPVACALLEFYPEAPDEELAALIEAMLPVELAALGLRVGGGRVIGPAPQRPG